MRTLKVRGWMKRELSLPNATYDTFTLQELMSGKYNFSDYEKWEESTGLLDKNGKEIYEGDIFGFVPVGTDEPEIYGDVFFDKDFAWFAVNQTNGGWERLGSYLMDMPATVCEIIGNIYENPNLLTQHNSEV